MPSNCQKLIQRRNKLCKQLKSEPLSPCTIQAIEQEIDELTCAIQDEIQTAERAAGWDKNP